MKKSLSIINKDLKNSFKPIKMTFDLILQAKIELEVIVFLITRLVPYWISFIIFK